MLDKRGGKISPFSGNLVQGGGGGIQFVIKLHTRDKIQMNQTVGKHDKMGIYFVSYSVCTTE